MPYEGFNWEGVKPSSGNYFTRLGLLKIANDDEIFIAYHLAQTSFAAALGAEYAETDQFKLLEEAYNTLREIGTRHEYRLLCACFTGDEEEVDERLLDINDINEVINPQGPLSPMTLAASSGHADIVALLLEKGADPTIRDKNGNTPFIQACLSNKIDVATLLFAHDPRLLNDCTENGLNALAICNDDQSNDALKQWLITQGLSLPIATASVTESGYSAAVENENMLLHQQRLKIQFMRTMVLYDPHVKESMGSDSEVSTPFFDRRVAKLACPPVRGNKHQNDKLFEIFLRTGGHIAKLFCPMTK